jgi:AraC family transcriptional regulator of adaptative response / DNA-3-methyladenine glycosylase II
MRAIPGVELFDGERYHRTLALPHGHGIAVLEPRESHVRAELSLADWRDLAPAVQRLRRLLDLDADPIAVDAVLGDDRVLEPLVAKTPGRRAPGAVDPFEIAVRGVVGQQVSVAGARTVTARIVEAAGDVLTVAHDRLTHVFPSPDRLAALDPMTLPMPRARGRTLTGLAGAVADGSIVLDTGADREQLVQRLVAVPGIGQWTARYTVMRGLGDPDVFLDTDLGVRHALDRLGIGATTADRWRPWRTYALHHLWATL